MNERRREKRNGKQNKTRTDRKSNGNKPAKEMRRTDPLISEVGTKRIDGSNGMSI